MSCRVPYAWQGITLFQSHSSPDNFRQFPIQCDAVIQLIPYPRDNRYEIWEGAVLFFEVKVIVVTRFVLFARCFLLLHIELLVGPFRCGTVEFGDRSILRENCGRI
jgi:hypothetical protein